MSSSNNILSGPKLSVDVYKGSLGQLLLDKLRSKEVDNVAQVHTETGESVTTGEFLQKAVNVAQGLLAQGLQPQDVVAVIGKNSSNLFAAIIGTLFSGGVFAPLDPSLKVFELEHMFKLYKPRFVFSDATSAEHVAKALAMLDNDATIIILDSDTKQGSTLTLEQLLSPTAVASFSAAGVVDQTQDVAFIVCSSGSTGLPKGVQVTHYGFLYQMALWQSMMQAASGLSWLQTSHMFWVSGVSLLIMACLFGIKLYFISEMSGLNIMKAVNKYKPVITSLPPAELVGILKSKDLENYDLSSLAMVTMGGAPVTETLVNLAKEKLPNTIIAQAYGMTELSGGGLSPASTEDIYSGGRLMTNMELMVVDQVTGKPVGVNETGELYFRSPVVMRGYVGNPEATKAAIDEQGWLHSGDVGYYNDSGLIYITGRIKDLIKYRNQQISPAEVEGVIQRIPEVLEAGVVGIPNEEDQYHAMALVVKQPDADVTEQDIVDFVKDNMSEFKQLRGGVVFVNSLPKTPTGKLKRYVLRDTAIQLYSNQKQ